MNRNVRAMLNEIDAFLAKYSKHKAAKELWDVLSALRGPDDPKDHSAKNGSTNIIRTVAFPRTARRDFHNGSNIPAAFARAGETLLTLPKRPDTVRGTTHFRRHIEKAAAALGLQTVEPEVR